jgi:hypothetical protein
MAKNRIEFDILGKFSGTEEAILEYLFTHDDGPIGTSRLAGALKPDRTSAEQQQEACEEIQVGLETLDLAGLIRRRRVPRSGSVYFENIHLTRKGEVAAMRERKRVNKVVVSIVYSAGEKIDEP